MYIALQVGENDYSEFYSKAFEIKNEATIGRQKPPN